MDARKLIDARELRIGNYISTGDNNYNADSNNIYDLQYGLAKFLPVILTEEWLTKFGFENIDYGHSRYLINPDKTIRLIWNNGWLYPQIEQAPEMSSESTQVVSLDRIKYVHELQNLYYALTHEEL